MNEWMDISTLPSDYQRDQYIKSVSIKDCKTVLYIVSSFYVILHNYYLDTQQNNR